MTSNTLPAFTPTADIPIADSSRIIATLVTGEDRIVFWPQHFKDVPQWATLEPYIFAWIDRWCTDYSGCIWNFYTLSNGGAFIAPEDDDGELRRSLFNDINGNGAELSSEAAGIAVCLMVYSHHACRTERCHD